SWSLRGGPVLGGRAPSRRPAPRARPTRVLHTRLQGERVGATGLCRPGGAFRDARRVLLDPHEFYILASRESVSVPPAYVAEMAPFDPLIGEYRVHYAGFFDPGFGYTEGKAPGDKPVLEVRSLDIPFILEDGQIVGRLVYDKLTDIPDQIYGHGIGSDYQAQSMRPSKALKQG